MQFCNRQEVSEEGLIQALCDHAFFFQLEGDQQHFVQTADDEETTVVCQHARNHNNLKSQQDS